MAVYITNDTDMTTVANAIRSKAGVTGGLVFPNGFVSAVNNIGAVPKESKIKYIIPATFTPPRTSDNLGFDAISFTFTRENINQLFNVDWLLQDATDFTTDGYWMQHINWNLFYQGNYNSQHLLFYTWSGAGKRGYIVPTSKLNNMAKTSLSTTFSVGSNTTTDPLYARNGQNYKGLILIYDSSYDGPPIVDETKLSQFFTCDYITAGM